MGPSHPLYAVEEAVAARDRADSPRWSRVKGILGALWVVSIFCLYLWHRADLEALGLRLLDSALNVFLLVALILILHALGRLISRAFINHPYLRNSETVDHTGTAAWSLAEPFSGGLYSSILYIGLGFGGVSLLMFGLGMFRLYYVSTGWAIFVAGTVLVVWDRRYLVDVVKSWRPQPFPWTGTERLLLSLYVVILSLGLACSLAPPFLGDDMVYHLYTPKTYLRHHGFIDLPFNIYTYFPMGGEMLYTLAMLVKGDVLAKLIHYFMGVLISIVIYGICRYIGLTRRMGLMGMLFFCSVPTVWFLMSWSAYIDLTLTFFLLSALLCYCGSWRSESGELLVLCGVYFGCALATKFTALYMAPVVFCGLLVRLRHELSHSSATPTSIGGALVKKVLFPMAIAFAMAAPWYIKNLYYTGNPFFPFFLNLFPVSHTGWDAERAGNYLVMLGHYGRAVKSFATYLLLPWDLTMEARLINPSAHDGILGPIFLMALPLLVWRRQWPWPMRILAAFSGIYCLAWALSSQQLRFLVPTLPALSVMAAFALSPPPDEHPVTRNRTTVLGRRAATGMAILAIVINTLVIGHYFAGVDPLPYLAGQENRDQYLSRRLDYYNIYSYINKALPSNSRIFLIDVGNFGYYLERDHLSDSIFEDHTIGRIVNQAASAEGIRQQLLKLGVTHLLYCQGILFNTATTPFGVAGRARFLEWLRQDGKLLKSDANFQLWEIKRD
ncbi:MAG: glycosyltransferase family 39 protein [Acidobacteria bacterium]|nr:glycosyltransferase family 39 protein [Acidobacteriota bacterium]MBI3657996.1 glycosyltransferase family 39 protein [Acidobacteriota bacterium]